ncbi:unnamed protein product [Mytilus edulis]|uniref:Peptidase A2 domain-containing protein n=1 Tax=Mytilus edulis TaxID=6550 RepID=A0A8S3RKX1_MYTED|nr:unnamed protein product [Mytilus edulis]
MKSTETKRFLPYLSKSNKKPQSRKFENKKSVHALEEDSDSDNCIASLETFEINNSKSSKDVMWLKPTVEGVTLKMEIDTGSAVSVISQADFSKRLGHVKLVEATITLQTYSGESIKPLRCANVKVHYKGETHALPLYVVPKGGPPLFGREWLKHIKLDWNEIREVHGINQKKTGEVIKDLQNKYKDVFKDELGTIKGIKAKLSLKDNSSPKYIKARTVPFSLRAKVEAELDRLEKEGTLNKVQHSEWATPIVPVLKKNGNVRICGDFKVTLNPMLNVDQYPLPKIDDIFANLNGGIQYTKMDLKQAYLQLEVDEDCKDLLTINTHRGLYRYNRMAFGIASAPAIWQRTIEQILSGIPGTQCLLDDMIITGSTDEEYCESTLIRGVTFCGHVIDKHGLHKTPDKIEAIRNAPAPENVSQLKSILGLINYYAKFLPDLSATLSPLHNLLRKDITWRWTKECQEAFDKVKDLVTSDMILTHFNPELPVTLACDASPYGLGAVISHRYPNGSDRPIAFASRSLAPAEKNYSQIDKEALGIIWGIKKFHSYLYGRKFKLITDHQPLIYIFNPQKGVSVTASARLQRYSLFLSGYEYEIEFRGTAKHANADSLSRLPLKSTEVDTSLKMVESFHIAQMEAIPVSNKQVQQETRNDRVLGLITTFTQDGWNTIHKDGEYAPYYSRRNELTVHQGCLMWGVTVIIPNKLRSQDEEPKDQEQGVESRFAEMTDNEIDTLIEDAENKNTKKATKWAVNVYEDWKNSKIGSGLIIPNLKDLSVQDINSILGKFVVEVRKKNGEKYPAKTLYLLVTGLLRGMRSHGVSNLYFLNESDDRFLRFRQILDAQMKKLTSDGYGINVKQADPISVEQEKILWDKSVFGEDDNGNYIEFRGKDNKTYNGGLRHRYIAPKSVRQYLEKDCQTLKSYQMYMNAIYEIDKSVSSPFYRRPVLSDGSVKFDHILGANRLGSLMKTICQKGELKGNFSNHSGKRTLATRLYQAGVSEQMIMDRTGHRSEKAVRTYKRPADSMLKRCL